MEIEKIQRFLKNKHKFDRKKEDFEIIEDIKKNSNKICNLIKKNNIESLDTAIASFILELIKVCNIYEFDLPKVIKEKLNYGL
ncbi:MAG: hypothetical protein GF364_03795 [Candidatus Lokiarchaeota archaeon]|nr:hypothetical protein [Candidatus Lokiarchaeota archaeon]